MNLETSPHTAERLPLVSENLAPLDATQIKEMQKAVYDRFAKNVAEDTQGQCARISYHLHWLHKAPAPKVSSSNRLASNWKETDVLLS